MISKYSIVLKLTALALLLSIAQVYVLAVPAVRASTPDTTPAVATGALLFGRLSTYGSGAVTINGNEARSGATVLSGAQLQTPQDTGATVALASAGRLDIAPGSNLMLTFDQGHINVNVLAGQALLTTNEGVKGALTTPDGKTELADGTSASSLGSMASAGDDATPPQNHKSHPCFIWHIPCALFWAMVGGGTAVATYFALRGNNASPLHP